MASRLSSPIHIVFDWSIGLDWWMGSKIQRKLKWHCGRSFRQRREVPFVIDLSVMDEMYAQREQHRIVNGAVWLMCVRLTQRLIKSLCSRKYKSSFFYNRYFTTVSAIDDNVAQFMIWDRNICVASEISMSAVGVTQ